MTAIEGPGQQPLVPGVEALRDGFDQENTLEPFACWDMEPLDSGFKDLSGDLTNFDPAKQLTADEALLHKWFHDI